MEGCPKALMINFDLKEISSFEEDAFEKPLSAYIQEYYGEDPKEYSKEIQQITQLRKGLSSIPRDKNGCNAIRKYYAQLHYLQSRFPMATGGVAAVPFIWHDIYSGEPVIYNDVRYEQACLLFNLGGLYSQLGANESRLADDSTKIACTHFQTAAGIYSYIKENFLLSDMPDMTDEILALKVAIMLGQSLECILEKSIRDDKNQSLIARICIQVKDYFNEAIGLLNHSGTSEMGSYLRKSWAKHLKIKMLCYEALAYSYMSNDAVKKEQYGHQVSYLKHANEQITEATKILKNQSDRVIEMVNFVVDVVGNKYNAAVKDNDFIYHMSIPELAALEEIKPVNFVKPIPFTFDDPTISGPDIFQKLIPLRAHEASSVYSEKKAEILRQVIASIQEKDDELSNYMTALKLEDLIDPKDDSLPDELITKNKFLQDNPDIIPKVDKDIEELAVKASKLDNLYSELTEKLLIEKEELGDVKMSSDLKTLIDDLDVNKDAHLKAMKVNNELVKIVGEKKEVIQFLSGSHTSILQSLPSQNVVEAPTDEPVVQRIREILSKVEKMKNQREKLLSQLREELNKDDITALLAVRERGEKDAFFEEQIKKHDETVGYINQNLAAQSNIIQALTEANAKYASTREKSIAITNQFDMSVKSYLVDITTFLDVKERIRSGLDFYKRLEKDVSNLQPKIDSFCEAQEKKRPKKSKAPPSRPTARKPDIMKSSTVSSSLQTPFSTNPMMVDSRLPPQHPMDGSQLPTPLNAGQFANQQYGFAGGHAVMGNSSLHPSPFNLNNSHGPRPNALPSTSAHPIQQNVPDRQYPMQQNQFPMKQNINAANVYPTSSAIGNPPQVNSNFNQHRPIIQPIVSTQGPNNQKNVIDPLNSTQIARIPMYNKNVSGNTYDSKNNVQMKAQNFQPQNANNPASMICQPNQITSQQHLSGIQQHPPGNLQLQSGIQHHHHGNHPQQPRNQQQPNGIQQNLPGYQQQPAGIQHHQGNQKPPTGVQQRPPGNQQHAPSSQQHPSVSQQSPSGIQQHHPQIATGIQKHPPGIQQNLPGNQQPGIQQSLPANQHHPSGIQPYSAGIQPHLQHHQTIQLQQIFQPLPGEMHIPPQHSTQQPSSVSGGLRKVQVNAHQLPTQQQSTVVSNYSHQLQQQPVQPTYQSQPVTSRQPPANFQLQAKGGAQNQTMMQQRYALQSGNEVNQQYTSQADSMSTRFPSKPVNQQHFSVAQHQPRLQQSPLPNYSQQALHNQQQPTSQVQFPAHSNNQSQSTSNSQYPTQPMGNQNHSMYLNRQVVTGQQAPMQQSGFHPEQQQKQQLQQPFQQQPHSLLQHSVPIQQQHPQPNHNITSSSYHQLRPQNGSSMILKKNFPAAQQPISPFQQPYDKNAAVPHNQGYQQMRPAAPIIDLLSDNNSLPLPLMPEKTGESSDTPLNQISSLDDSSMICPRGTEHFSNVSNSQPKPNAMLPVQQAHQIPAASQNPNFVKQESHELIYPRQDAQENQISTLEPNISYPNPGMAPCQISPKPIVDVQNIDKKLNINIPSAPVNHTSSTYNPGNYPNQMSSSMPYAGPSITQSNAANHSGLLFASKPMMSPTLTPPHDPVVSNILGKGIVPNIDMTQIAQLNFQQIHLQSMVLQQQQLIAMLQTQQNQQRSEEENKIQILQQQIADQQKLIDYIKEEKEKEDEKLSNKTESEEDFKNRKENDGKNVKPLDNVNLSIVTSASTSTLNKIENGCVEKNDNVVELPTLKNDINKSVVENECVLLDSSNLEKEKCSLSNTVSAPMLIDVNSDNIPISNVIASNHVPFYEPKLDTKVDDDDTSLILPRGDMENNVQQVDNEDANVPKHSMSDDDEDIIQPRSGETVVLDNSPVEPIENDKVKADVISADKKDLNEDTEMYDLNLVPSLNETPCNAANSTIKERKRNGNVFSSPNTSRCSSKRSTPSTSGRSSPNVYSNSQGVQLDDMDNRERKISEAVDHRHLARQLGRMSFYVGGPEETIWLRYIQELEVAVSKLHTLCKSLCKRVENMDIDGFLQIWNDLGKREELDVRNFSSTAGESNISKNRYRDILPWDHTRVKLLSTENDYVNANSIQNLTPHSPHYIATQGPIPQTFSDFWTMVWEQKSPVIVMLTNEIEGTKLKCHHYWGREVDSRLEFDNLIVILMDEMTTSGWKIRTFTIVDKKSENTRMVKQFQFTSWPDYGTPESPYELLSFMEDIHQCHKEMDATFKTPIVLHCSAGVGRTGSFCCIYSAIREMQGQNGLIDIPGVIRKLRQYRPHMVQRKEQLIFCYQAVLCFAQQFTATEMHKISNPRFREDAQYAMDISYEASTPVKDTYDNSNCKRDELTSHSDSKLSNGSTDNSVTESSLEATCFENSQDSQQGTDNIPGNSKFKINSGIFQSTRTSCVEQSNLSDNLKPEGD